MNAKIKTILLKKIKKISYQSFLLHAHLCAHTHHHNSCHLFIITFSLNFLLKLFYFIYRNLYYAYKFTNGDNYFIILINYFIILINVSLWVVCITVLKHLIGAGNVLNGNILIGANRYLVGNLICVSKKFTITVSDIFLLI